MAAPGENEDRLILFDLCRGISVRQREAETHRRAAAAAPPGPGRLPSVPVIRAQNELNSIERERRSSLSRLRLHTRELNVERIEKLKSAGILGALIDLQTHP